MKQFNDTEILPVIGMSPGNPYFTEEIITDLVHKVYTKYHNGLVFIPDIPAISTYHALDYEKSKARGKKSIPQGNGLTNKLERVLNHHNFSDDQLYNVKWNKDVQSTALYKESYVTIKGLFNSNLEFKSAIQQETAKVLLSKNKMLTHFEWSILIGAEYILSEFAFLEICPQLFGCEEARYIYHRPWEVYKNYIQGVFDGKPRPYLSFEQITFE